MATKKAKKAKIERVEITTEDGEPDGWFDRGAAEGFAEELESDGSNLVSLATGDQWEHEEIYRTRRGAWILHHWSGRQGSRERYRKISPEQAAAWLVRCKHQIPASLSKVLDEQEV